MSNSPDAILLFSGGLDSILSGKLLEAQGLSVTCVHFVSPFFGNPESARHWQNIYGFNIIVLDIGNEFASMLVDGPKHGFGKNLNPCVDCKIMQIARAKELMLELGAKFIATGEVLGQRPMSQRPDSLRAIQKQAGAGDILLRPLSAKLLEPVSAERNGIVDRSKLLNISGRGRNSQLELAREFKLAEIPGPAGGCRLTEKENVRRYWQILKIWRQKIQTEKYDSTALTEDFVFANAGRHFWFFKNKTPYWLAVGRNKADNDALLKCARPDDALMRLACWPGPLALARGGGGWPPEILADAAAHMASYAPKAAKSGKPAKICLMSADMNTELHVWPVRNESWHIPEWAKIRQEIRGQANGQ